MAWGTKENLALDKTARARIFFMHKKADYVEPTPFITMKKDAERVNRYKQLGLFGIIWHGYNLSRTWPQDLNSSRLLIGKIVGPIGKWYTAVFA